MTRSFSRRLAALEAVLAPKPTPWPVIVRVRPDEAISEAVARHYAEHGLRPKLHQGGLLVVPQMPLTDEEIAAGRKRTEVRQAALMKFVRQSPASPKIEGMAQ